MSCLFLLGSFFVRDLLWTDLLLKNPVRAFGSLPDCYRLPAPRSPMVPWYFWGDKYAAGSSENLEPGYFSPAQWLHSIFFAWKERLLPRDVADQPLEVRYSKSHGLSATNGTAMKHFAPIFAALPRKKKKTPMVPVREFGEFTRWTCSRFRQAKGRTSCDSLSHWKEHFGGPFLAATRSRRRLHAKAASSAVSWLFSDGAHGVAVTVNQLRWVQEHKVTTLGSWLFSCWG